MADLLGAEIGDLVARREIDPQQFGEGRLCNRKGNSCREQRRRERVGDRIVTGEERAPRQMAVAPATYPVAGVGLERPSGAPLLPMIGGPTTRAPARAPALD